MKHIIIILLLSGICFNGYGQRRYAADRYFEEYAYSKSAKSYQNLYDRGGRSYQILSRLADSYYFTASYKKAEETYRELMDQYEVVASPEHFFRYAQVLKSNGDISGSDKWLLKLKKSKENDSRVLALEKNKKYYSEYSNRPKAYTDIHNLSINTKFSDFGGFVHNGNFYFSSSRSDSKSKKLYKWNNQPYLNLYKSTELAFKEGVNLDVEGSEKLTSLNSKLHESNAIITKDGNVIYFTRSHAPGNKRKPAKLKIFKAKKQENETWGAIEELPFNNEDYSIGHPTLSSDEKTLYFVSDMPGGYGDTDLYKVSISDDGVYGEPENLGKKINTEGREMFPYVTSNDKLYFASDGHLGLGALDVFQSDLEGKGYGIPVNLGSPINGPMDDFGFIIDEDREVGYFSSNRSGGKGDDDIYSFKASKCNDVISGVIREAKTGNLASGVSVRLIDDKGDSISEQTTSSDGIYKFTDLGCDRKYTVTMSNSSDYVKDQLESTISDVNDDEFRGDIVLEPSLEANSDNNDNKLRKNVASTNDNNERKGNVALADNKKRKGTVSLGVNNKSEIKITKPSSEAFASNNNNSELEEDMNLEEASIIENQLGIDPIYFDFDSDFIREDAKIELEHIVDVMKEYPEIVILIESHTDTRGSSKYNERLSQKRANSTKKYIISRGISSYRIKSAIGYGESKLVNDCSVNCSEKEHEENRRSHFRIIQGLDTIKSGN